MNLFPAGLNKGKLAERFYALGFFSLLTLWVSFAFSPALVEITSITGLIGWLVWKNGSGQPLFNFSRKVWVPLTLFIALSVVSVFFSEYPSKSFRGIFKILQQVMIFFLAADLLAPEKKRRFFEKFFIASSLLVLADGIFQYFAGFDFLRFHAPEDSGAGVRLTAGFGTYGKLAAYLVSTIPFLAALGVYYNSEKKRSLSIASFAITAGLLVLLFLTRSRGAFLGLFAGAFLTFLFSRKYKLLLALFLAGATLLPFLPHNMIIHLDAERKEQSVVERYYLWDRAVHVIKAKPLTGTGINTYAVAHQKYDATNNWRVRNYYAHNGYLQMAAETGIPCLLSFLWFLFSCLRTSFKELPNFKDSVLLLGTLAGILNFMIFASVDTLFHSAQPAILFWYLCGLLVVYSPKLKNN